MRPEPGGDVLVHTGDGVMGKTTLLVEDQGDGAELTMLARYWLVLDESPPSVG